MDEEKGQKCPCGMPLSDDTKCTCQPDVCIHCCTCADNCSCGCPPASQGEALRAGKQKAKDKE